MMGLERTSYYNDKVLKLICDTGSLDDVIEYAYKKTKKGISSQLDFIVLLSVILQMYEFEERIRVYHQRKDKLEIDEYLFSKDYEKYIIYTTAVTRIYYYLSGPLEINNKFAQKCITGIFSFFNESYFDLDGIVYHDLMSLFARILSTYRISYLSELYFGKCEKLLNVLEENHSSIFVYEYITVQSYHGFLLQVKHLSDFYLTSLISFYLDFSEIDLVLHERDVFYKAIKWESMLSTDVFKIINTHKSNILFYKTRIDEVKSNVMKHGQIDTIKGLGFGLVNFSEKVIIKNLVKSFCRHLESGNGTITFSVSSEDRTVILSFMLELLEYFSGIQKDFDIMKNKENSVIEEKFFIKKGFSTCIDALNKIIVLFYILQQNKIEHKYYPSFSGREKIKDFMEKLLDVTNSHFLIGLHNCIFCNDLRGDIVQNKRNNGVHSFYGKVEEVDKLSLINCYKFTLSIYQNTILYFLEGSR